MKLIFDYIFTLCKNIEYTKCIENWLKSFYGEIFQHNYIEYFSWISTGILSFIALLTIFLSLYFQEYILKARRILYKLKTDTINHEQLKKKLEEYIYTTTTGIKGFSSAFELFKYISWGLIALWILSGVGYLINVDSIGGKIHSILSTALISITLFLVIRNCQKAVNRDLLPLKDILDINEFMSRISPQNEYVLSLLMPKFVIESSYEGKIEFTYHTSINLNNYSIIMCLRERKLSGTYIHVGTFVKYNSKDLNTVSNTEINEQINYNNEFAKMLRNISEASNECHLFIYIKDKIMCYKCKIMNNHDSETIRITCIPDSICQITVPFVIKKFHDKSMRRANSITTAYPGKP